MIIACPACHARYSLPDGAIGAQGRTVRCAQCRHSWFQEGGSAEAEASAPPPVEETVVSGPADPAPSEEARPERTAARAATAAPAMHPDEAIPYEGDSAAPPAAPPPAPEANATAAPAATRPAAARRAPAVAAPPAPEYENYGEQEVGPRSRTRLWLVVLLAALVVAAVVFAATRFYGSPDWLSGERAAAFTGAPVDLALDFPAEKQDRRTLPNGREFFGASGTITNVGQETRRVPPVLVVLRDANECIVYSWELQPPKRNLEPGETMTINEAVTDVPRSARVAEIGWKIG